MKVMTYKEMQVKSSSSSNTEVRMNEPQHLPCISPLLRSRYTITQVKHFAFTVPHSACNSVLCKKLKIISTAIIINFSQ